MVHHREQHLDIEVGQQVNMKPAKDEAFRSTRLVLQVLAEASGSLLSHNFTGFLGRTPAQCCGHVTHVLFNSQNDLNYIEPAAFGYQYAHAVPIARCLPQAGAHAPLA